MRTLLPLTLVLMVLMATGCGVKEKKPDYDITATFAELSSSYQELMDLRTQLGELEKKIEILEDAKKRPKNYKKEDLPVEDLATLQAERDQLKPSIEEKLAGFMDSLTMFLNKGLNEFQNAPETAKAVRMFSDENILIAEEYIQKGGKYGKAIEIYQQALTYDPEYETLLNKLKEAQDFKSITRERFDQVKSGMTMDQVKEICGVPNINYIKEHQKGKKTVISWYYPREDANAAGIYFSGGKVYQTSWTALKQQE